MEYTKLTEKYRPTDLNNICGNTNIIQCLKSFSLLDFPNMLFYGPPGTGKTTTIKALIHNKINPINILELNASDDRGINIVRNQIKQFAETSTQLRIVILDEADSMSKDAQNALRRIMEDYENCRFCLICNYVKNIIDPIQSRCAKFKFSNMKDEEVKCHALEIINKENIVIEDIEGISMLVSAANGDMRKLINDIQGIKKTYNKIDKKHVQEFLGIVDQDQINKICGWLLNPEISFKNAYMAILNEDIECETILQEIFKKILTLKLDNKFAIIQGLSEIEYALAKGCNDKIQLSALVGLFKET